MTFLKQDQSTWAYFPYYITKDEGMVTGNKISLFLTSVKIESV